MKLCQHAMTLHGALGLVATALLLASAPPSASAQATECAPTERTVFSCSTGSRAVAVCASADLAETGGFLQYRFGRPAASELVYPPAHDDWRAVTRGGTLVFSGGGGAFLAFSKERYRYIVYTAIGQGWGGRAGVVVEQAGKRIAKLACKGPVVSELGPDLFSAAGIASGEASFDLP